MKKTFARKWLSFRSASVATALGIVTLAAAAQTGALTTVNLTAQRMGLTLPDGTNTSMWGYCSDDKAQNPALNGGRLLNVNACATTSNGANRTWAPGPTIVLPVGNQLTIHLKNELAAGTSTSLVILGQIGGSAGNPTRDAAPVDHPAQTSTTWPVNSAGSFTPPQQALRARAFAQEAAFNGTIAYTWNTNIAPSASQASYLKPGTYLYETGSHPSLQAPMGLYGVLIVTRRPSYEIEQPGTAEASQTL